MRTLKHKARQPCPAGKRSLAWLLAVLLLALPLHAEPAAKTDQRTRVKPGWNMFSERQDIELGRKAAQDAEKQLPALKDKAVNDYLNRLGARLVRHTPGHRYPYQFKAVNQEAINAFALPGGFLYLNRGTIEAAENEAQLAGVMAHEIAHVALRHGTNQLTKATFAQAPLAILGGMFGGGGGIVGQLAQLGVAVGFTAVFLKYSRSAETQADILGAQILYDAGYDPREMAAFFETLAAQNKQRSIEFFSSHPHPENRQERIMEEVRRLGGPRANARKDSEEFHLIQERVRSLPPPPKPGQKRRDSGRETTGKINRPALPSDRLVRYRDRDFLIYYPENWEAYQRGAGVTLAPPEGIYSTRQGDSVGYGVMINIVELDDPRALLDESTDWLLEQLQESNPGMREVSRRRIRVAGQRALQTKLVGDSPLPGEREIDWLYTLQRGDDLIYLIFIVPASDERRYRRTFQEMLESFRLR